MAAVKKRKKMQYLRVLRPISLKFFANAHWSSRHYRIIILKFKNARWQTNLILKNRRGAISYIHNVFTHFTEIWHDEVALQWAEIKMVHLGDVIVGNITFI